MPPPASPILSDDLLSRCLLADRERLLRTAGKLKSLERAGKPSDRTRAELEKWRKMSNDFGIKMDQ